VSLLGTTYERRRRVSDEQDVKAEGRRRWISRAIKRKGALRRTLGVKKGETISASALAAAAKQKGKTGQRARLAQTLRKLNR